MEIKAYHLDRLEEVAALFKDVFTESENSEEGLLISQLCKDMHQEKAADVFGYIAEKKGKIIGCILFTRLSFESPAKAFILAPVAIATKFQKQGIGQKLIRFGLDDTRNRNVDYVFTYGDPNYYSKVGFEQISESQVKAPLKLSFPHGWLAQSLGDKKLSELRGQARCVDALNPQHYW